LRYLFVRAILKSLYHNTKPLQYEILKNPMGLIEFTLNKDEKVTAEAAAMVYITGNIITETKMRKGGFLKSLKAAALGGESFFVNEFIAQEDNCKLGLTGNTLGDIQVIPVQEEFIVQSGAFVGSTGDLMLDTEWQGFTKGIFGTNLFMLKTVGNGDMFVNAWGGIIQKTLQQGERMLLDNYQLVALSGTAGYRVTKHGSLKTSIFGGEALVIEITGPGTVYIQTKNVMEFVRSIIPFLPKRN
jgi:uncharacterized protein (TIGR00266 family)